MNLKPKQIQAATLLAQGWLCKDVAEEIQVTPQTISEWKNIPEFEACINDLKTQSIEAARAQIQSLAESAVDTISELMESSESDNVRLKAALAMLAHAGLTEPSSGLFAWGVGGTTAEEVERDRARERHIKQAGSNFLGL